MLDALGELTVVFIGIPGLVFQACGGDVRAPGVLLLFFTCGRDVRAPGEGFLSRGVVKRVKT